MRHLLRIFLCNGMLGLIGCAAGHQYDTHARYEHNGVGEVREPEWMYIERRQRFEVESFRSSGDPWQYPMRSHQRVPRRADRSPADPDTSYRRNEKSDTRDRDRDQQRDSSNTGQSPSDDFNPRGPQNNREDKSLDRSSRSKETPPRRTIPDPSVRPRRR